MRLMSLLPLLLGSVITAAARQVLENHHDESLQHIEEEDEDATAAKHEQGIHHRILVDSESVEQLLNHNGQEHLEQEKQSAAYVDERELYGHYYYKKPYKQPYPYYPGPKSSHYGYAKYNKYQYGPDHYAKEKGVSTIIIFINGLSRIKTNIIS